MTRETLKMAAIAAVFAAGFAASAYAGELKTSTQRGRLNIGERLEHGHQ